MDQVGIGQTGDLFLFIVPIAVDPQAQDPGHHSGREPIGLPKSPDLIRKGNAVFGTVLIVDLPEVESRQSGVGKGLPTVTTQIARSEEHTSELQSRENLVCRLLLEK